MLFRTSGLFAVVSAIAILTACSGSEITPRPSLANLAEAVSSTRLPLGASPQPLVYVVDQSNYDTDIDTYPNFKIQQTLPDLPGSVCTDAAGHVWFVIGDEVLEFAHGGTTPIATLHDSTEFTQSCAVDPSSGTLAVGILTSASDVGGILLFAHGRGQPKLVQGISEVYFLAYDSHGNLFGDGMADDFKKFVLFELLKGSKSVRPMKVVGATIQFAGTVQYTQNVLNIGDQSGAVNYETHVDGATAKVTSKTELKSSSDCNATFIYNDRLFCPDIRDDDLKLYVYPKGGNPVKILPVNARTAVISVVTK